MTRDEWQNLYNTDPLAYYRELTMQGSEAETALRVLEPILNERTDSLINRLSHTENAEEALNLWRELRTWTRLSEELGFRVTRGNEAAEKAAGLLDKR
jgi:transcriptional regulator of met regulon